MKQFYKQIDTYPKIFLTIIWLLAILIVNPIGDFPLNDDWVYAYSVKELLAGNWVILDIVSLNLFGQMIWGYLFSAIFGYSYTILRLSVLILSLITILGAYQLILDSTKSKNRALLGAILIFFNPIFFSLSFTFMTDVPFLTCCIWALVYYFRALDLTSIHYNLLLAGLLTFCAASIRQVGLFLPVAYLAYFLIQKRWKIWALIPLMITISGMWLLKHFLGHVHTGQGQITDLLASLTSINGLVQAFLRLLPRLGGVFLFSGLFFFPLILFATRPLWLTMTTKAKKYLAIISLPLIGILFLGFAKFPAGNIFYNLGVGPKTLKDAYLIQANNLTTASSVIWIAINILTLLGGFLLIFYLLNVIWQLFTNSKIPKKNSFFWLAFLTYLPFIVLLPAFFDRYTLPLLILMLLGIISGLPKEISVKFSYKMILPFMILILFSVFSTKDYLNWNRLRWDAIHHLNEKGITFKDIEGGYESSEAWIEQEGEIPLYYDYITSFKKAVSNRSLEYVISFGELPNYSVLKKYEYQRFIPFQKEEILILKKNNAD